MKRRVESDTPVQRDATEPAGTNPATTRPVCIRYGGRDFIASSEMAGIFLRRAQRLIDDGDAQLVPLLHRDGIELLYVDAKIPFSVHDTFEQAWLTPRHEVV